jgi:geranylgeranyl reductase family protein
MGRFDVVIVGAGPAGAWAAFRLARAGAIVGLIDGSHPREKPCGGGITGRALEIVRPALDSGSLCAVNVEGATFTHAARRAYLHLTADDAGSPPLVVTGRREFDSALLGAAVAAGAQHIPTRVIGVRRTHDEGHPLAGWIAETRSGRVAARWLLGADGAASLVRRQVFRPFARADLSIATGCFVRNRSSRDIVVAFENDPPGYLWSFSRPDHLAVGACAQADHASSSALLRTVTRWVARHVGLDATVERYSWPIPSLREATLATERVAGDRWMLLGDAAGMVDPITREGIYFALRSGDLAADSLIADRDPAHQYTERVAQEIHRELTCAAALKARFFRPRFMNLLVTALDTSPRIGAVMADLVAGRQPYHNLRRRLLQTLDFRLMFELFGC